MGEQQQGEAQAVSPSFYGSWEAEEGQQNPAGDPDPEYDEKFIFIDETTIDFHGIDRETGAPLSGTAGSPHPRQT